METTKSITLKRVLEVFFQKIPLDFFKHPPKDLRGSLSCQFMVPSEDLSCEKIFDAIINDGHKLTGRKERQRALKFTTSLQEILDNFNILEDEIKKEGLSSEVKGDLLNVYLRLIIKKLYLIYVHEDL